MSTTAANGHDDKLAVEGGTKTLTAPIPMMHPGGMRVGKEEEAAVIEVIRSKRLFRYSGPNWKLEPHYKVSQLEKNFAAHMGANHAVAVTSGTASLICGLGALGVGPGDEVIVPAYTWISTAAAVVHLGAVPIMAECDDALTMDPVDTEKKITPRTKVILPVHMRGTPCKMDEFVALCKKHNLRLLEDTAQADGGSYKGKRLGTWGDIGCFSFQFNKIITSGEGGMVITNDPEWFKRILMFHDTEGGKRNNIPPGEILPGINFRMGELCGAVVLAQLGKLEEILADMRRNKKKLKDGMTAVAQKKGIVFKREHDEAGDAAISLIFYLQTTELAQKVADALLAEGIDGTFKMYSPTFHDNHIYCWWRTIMEKRVWHPNSGPWKNHPVPVEYSHNMCPVTLDFLGRAVHLDVSPDLSEQNLSEMTLALNKVLEKLVPDAK